MPQPQDLSIEQPFNVSPETRNNISVRGRARVNEPDIRISQSMLDVRSYSDKPHPYCTPDDYEVAFNKYFQYCHQPHILNRDLSIIQLIIEKFYNNEAGHKYFASKVFYSQTEHFISSRSKKKYPKPKQNTYYLCPYCDPFENANRIKGNFDDVYDKRSGNFHEVDENLPKFYDTLASGYTHHMAQVHGVTKYQFLEQPFIGISHSKITRFQEKDDLTLSCICPYNKYGTNEPCLAEVAFQALSKDENPYKAYFRHASSHHIKKTSPDTSSTNKKATMPVKVCYKPFIENPDISGGGGVENIFIPLNKESYERALDVFNRHCDPKYKDVIKVKFDKEALEKCGIMIDFSDDEKEEEDDDEDDVIHSFSNKSAVNSLNLLDNKSILINNFSDYTERNEPTINNFIITNNLDASSKALIVNSKNSTSHSPDSSPKFIPKERKRELLSSSNYINEPSLVALINDSSSFERKKRVDVEKSSQKQIFHLNSVNDSSFYSDESCQNNFEQQKVKDLSYSSQSEHNVVNLNHPRMQETSLNGGMIDLTKPEELTKSLGASPTLVTSSIASQNQNHDQNQNQISDGVVNEKGLELPSISYKGQIFSSFEEKKNNKTIEDIYNDDIALHKEFDKFNTNITDMTREYNFENFLEESAKGIDLNPDNIDLTIQLGDKNDFSNDEINNNKYNNNNFNDWVKDVMY